MYVLKLYLYLQTSSKNNSEYASTYNIILYTIIMIGTHDSGSMDTPG